MSNNPFTYGNPIKDPKRFFGRSYQVEQVLSRFGNLEFESSSLVGERRIGKTSLLYYLLHPDTRPQELNSSNYLFIYEDLHNLRQSATPARLWQRLLQQMSLCCKHTEAKQEIEKTRAADLTDEFIITDLFKTLAIVDQYVVFLLDEFEHVTTNKSFNSDFFLHLRSLATGYRLALVTSSCRELVELCHSEAIQSSPFFNIFANITLQLLTEDEARQLILYLLNGTGICFTEADFTLIFRVAGTHPYLLKAAAYFLFESYKSARSDKETFFQKEFEREATPHLEHYWLDSNDQEKIVLTTLALLDHQKRIEGITLNKGQQKHFYERSGQTITYLEKRSLILQQADSTYRLFNTSFGDWICKEITSTMRDQQTYEEWFNSNKRTLDRMTEKVKREVGDILPRISSKYRELIVTWVSDPNNLAIAANLLKAMLGH